ncbi:uncharacterized protein EDB91DRAFT_1079429 [Suillus paluster]|uniref:uncharacterized protein n=1 Tax=Suillus paluster TaxID=48578 RepID=UPI001B86F794|nr:uncharacterized protein EDB91DRAFT_1079429 [Suillus paluster]KAG1748477.1 hypothetical protein EDB91DRAFT_1079429 [Suillus paluster]
MISSMKDHDWPEDRVDMHIQFWSALQTHRWRHAADPLKQRALLLYQAQQRRRWHLTAGTVRGWSLEKINQDLLLEAREELFNEQHEKLTIIAIQEPHPATTVHAAITCLQKYFQCITKKLRKLACSYTNHSLHCAPYPRAVVASSSQLRHSHARVATAPAADRTPKMPATPGSGISRE